MRDSLKITLNRIQATSSLYLPTPFRSVIDSSGCLYSRIKTGTDFHEFLKGLIPRNARLFSLNILFQLLYLSVSKGVQRISHTGQLLTY